MERRLARAEVVDDVMQEAAVEALLLLDALRRPDRFGPWLCGIALNVVRRWWRQSRREVPVADMLEPPVEPPALDFETAAGVRDALAHLPAGQRSALVLFYFADLPVGEIAERLGTSPGAVKTRLHAGRAGLRRQPELEREEPTMPPDDDRFLELTVADVRREPEGSEPMRRHVTILRERDGARVLPIWMGPAEATQIALALQGKELPRPTAYVFMERLLDTAGVRLREARITRLDGVTFHAEAVVEGLHGSAAVDARPSDAINLALAAGRPVTAAAALLEEAQAHTELSALEAAHPEEAGRITADALERLRMSLEEFEAERRRRR